MRVLTTKFTVFAVLATFPAGGAALRAQETGGTVLGFVYDASTGNPIPQVEVEMTGELTVTATTTIEGSFMVEGVPVGVYTVSYKSEHHEGVSVEGLEVLAGEMADASTVMSSMGETTTVTVRSTIQASVATQEAMLVERRLASTVSDTISAEEIRDGTSSDASEAIEKVTGVTTMNDFVFVRGLDPRYSGTTLNNALLASTEPERRVVPLDLFPASLIDSIKVQKTYAPDLPGEFSAGLVQVETTEFPTRPTLNVSYSIGYNSQTQGRTFLDYPGGGRDFFGFDDGMRDLPDSIPGDQRIDRFAFSRDELQALGRSFSNNWERVPRDLSRPAMSWNIVAGNTYGKLGVVGALAFSNSMQSIFDQERNYYLPNPQAALGDANAGPPVLASEFDYDESTESVRLGGVLNVSYQFSPAHKIALKNFLSRDTDDNARYYEGFYQDFNTDIRNQRLRYIERTIRNSQVEGDHLFAGMGNSVLTWAMSYSKATRDEPDLRESLQIYQPRRDTFVFFDDSQSAFRMFNDLDETILNPSVDMLVPFYRGTFSGAVKFGANYSSRGRNFRSRRFRLNLRRSRGIDLTLAPSDLFAEGNIHPRGFELNETTRVTDAYRGTRDVFGYYGMLELNLAARWRIIGGLRVEDVDQDVTTFNQFLPATGREPAPFATMHILPALNVIYSLTPKQNLRVGYSQTVSRPDFRELARFGFLDVVGGLQTIGNPDLAQTDISNYDVRWEYFPGGNQLLAASFFFKNFDRPIEQTMIAAVALLRTYLQRACGAQLRLRVRIPAWIGLPHSQAAGIRRFLESHLGRLEHRLGKRRADGCPHVAQSRHAGPVAVRRERDRGMGPAQGLQHGALLPQLLLESHHRRRRVRAARRGAGRARHHGLRVRVHAEGRRSLEATIHGGEHQQRPLVPHAGRLDVPGLSRRPHHHRRNELPRVPGSDPEPIPRGARASRRRSRGEEVAVVPTPAEGGVRPRNALIDCA